MVAPRSNAGTPCAAPNVPASPHQPASGLHTTGRALPHPLANAWCAQAWAARHFPALLATLRPGASDEALEAAGAALGGALPPALKAMYRWAVRAAIAHWVRLAGCVRVSAAGGGRQQWPRRACWWHWCWACLVKTLHQRLQ